MAVKLQPVSGAAVNFADNLCRWDRARAGHYEVWFLTLNKRASQRGFWFRYTLMSPSRTDDDLAARSALWAAAFDRRRPGANILLKREYGIDNFTFDGREDFRLNIGDGEFSSSRATGTVTQGSHRIDWDLSFTPNRETYHHISPFLKLIARPKSFICSPNLDARFSGRVVIDGREIILDEEPGCQSHLWGRKQVDEWVWVHSNAFEKNPGTVFEGLAARQRHFSGRFASLNNRLMPPLQSLYLRHAGEEHRFIRMRMAEQWERRLGIGYWTFSAMNPHIRIDGTAQCRMRDMLQVEYTDPDGERLYCINSEIAHLKIRLFRRVRGLRWRYVETIKAHATAHLEHASRTTDPDVKMAGR
ncbi:MAG: hypothetical protein L0229_29870 [Blastocatellia bacterium]|nr:hypothetical protein [Blastocatellia bacterium]